MKYRVVRGSFTWGKRRFHPGDVFDSKLVEKMFNPVEAESRLGSMRRLYGLEPYEPPAKKPKQVKKQEEEQADGD